MCEMHANLPRALHTMYFKIYLGGKSKVDMGKLVAWRLAFPGGAYDFDWHRRLHERFTAVLVFDDGSVGDIQQAYMTASHSAHSLFIAELHHPDGQGPPPFQKCTWGKIRMYCIYLCQRNGNITMEAATRQEPGPRNGRRRATPSRPRCKHQFTTTS